MSGAGVRHFVNKPYRLAEVEKTVRSLIEEH
jgi:hypothetical protein